jgi:hypothetical protein
MKTIRHYIGLLAIVVAIATAWMAIGWCACDQYRQRFAPDCRAKLQATIDELDDCAARVREYDEFGDDSERIADVFQVFANWIRGAMNQPIKKRPY